MRISIIGTGYVGLVTGVCLSEFGFSVTCIDQDRDKIDLLNRGEVPIYEPGLETMLRKNSNAGRLKFTKELNSAVSDADLVFIAVGTPTQAETGAVNMSYVEQAAVQIADNLKGFTVIVTKSTVSVGSARKLQALIRARNPQADFEMASNPEFLREGSAITDFMQPDRIVIGAESDRARDVMQQLYKPLTQRGTPTLWTDFQSAELTKYAANSFLAMKVTYINQIADLCGELGANAHDVAKGIGLDDRIGPRFLQPGPGIGGSCFPKDTLALTALAREIGQPISLIDTVVSANIARKQAMADWIIEIMGGNLAGKRIGILGVSFKPNTDDMREAPSLDIIPLLQQAGAAISAYDPVAMQEAAKLLERVDWRLSAREAAEDADALVILTEWNEFKALDLNMIAGCMRAPLLIDLRGIYNLEEVAQTPLTYYSVGRPAVKPNWADSAQVISGS